ncbi:MAG TPA: metal-dependent hydrolase [Candidatus Sulfopaludibacter sp.]|jgi:inner membrane protein|nr:metal-dependent hydrolase [Candidatus Sulfopaludibacter sp.]
MDNLTHTAIGFFLSRAGLNRWTPAATPILLLAANIPDLDVVSAAGGSLNYLHYHRHLTHSLVALPLMAALSVILVRVVWRKPFPWLPAFAAACLGVASHLLLDLTNMYGIRLLLPFSDSWQQLDLNSVVDLWIWAALILGIAAPFLAGLVGGEITSGALRRRYPSRGGAFFALSFILLYDCGREVMHTRAVATLESRIYRGIAPARVAALPDEVNPLHWRGLIETTDFYAVADLNLAGEFDPTRVAVFPKPDPDPAIDAAGRTHTFQEFLRFAQYPYWHVLVVPDPEGAKEVRLVDMRFQTFVARAVVDPQGRVVDQSFTLGFSPRK